MSRAKQHSICRVPLMRFDVGHRAAKDNTMRFNVHYQQQYYYSITAFSSLPTYYRESFVRMTDVDDAIELSLLKDSRANRSSFELDSRSDCCILAEDGQSITEESRSIAQQTVPELFATNRNNGAEAINPHVAHCSKLNKWRSPRSKSSPGNIHATVGKVLFNA